MRGMLKFNAYVLLLEIYFISLKNKIRNIMKDILFEQDNYYVTNEGNKEKPNYHVWVPGCTHSKCDSAYLYLDLAISRCKYLANNKVKIN